MFSLLLFSRVCYRPFFQVCTALPSRRQWILQGLRIETVFLNSQGWTTQVEAVTRKRHEVAATCPPRTEIPRLWATCWDRSGLTKSLNACRMLPVGRRNIRPQGNSGGACLSLGNVAAGHDEHQRLLDGVSESARYPFDLRWRGILFWKVTVYVVYTTVNCLHETVLWSIY